MERICRDGCKMASKVRRVVPDIMMYSEILKKNTPSTSKSSSLTQQPTKPPKTKKTHKNQQKEQVWEFKPDSPKGTEPRESPYDLDKHTFPEHFKSYVEEERKKQLLMRDKPNSQRKALLVVWDGSNKLTSERALKTCFKAHMNAMCSNKHTAYACDCQHITWCNTVKTEKATYMLVKVEVRRKTINLAVESFIEKEGLNCIEAAGDYWFETRKTVANMKKQAKKDKVVRTAFLYKVPEESRETAIESIKRMMPDFHRVEFPVNSSTLIATVVDNQHNNAELNKLYKEGLKIKNTTIKAAPSRNNKPLTVKDINIKLTDKTKGTYECTTTHKGNTLKYTITQCTWCLSLDHVHGTHKTKFNNNSETSQPDQCRESKHKCHSCLEFHVNGRTHPKSNAPPKCVNCKGNHRATDPACPVIRKKAEDIKTAKIRATEKRAEAAKNGVKCTNCNRLGHTIRDCYHKEGYRQRAGHNRNQHNHNYHQNRATNPHRSMTMEQINQLVIERMGMTDNRNTHSAWHRRS